jgi:Sugar (and other) transporter.
VIAYFIIPIKWTYPVFDFFLMCSWRIFLIVSTFPSLAGALLVFFIPESPKFLMTHGRSDDALDVFQSMYARNTGKPKDSYPVIILLSRRASGAMLNLTLSGAIHL